MKNNNHAFLRLFFAVLCLALAWNVPARAEIVVGKQYAVHTPAEPTETGKNIEVLEFFSYACPHCNDLEPVLEPWVKKLPPDVTFRRIPAVFSDSWMPYAKIYYAAEAMGILEKLHPLVFHAVHVEHANLADEKTLKDWLVKEGVDSQKFMDMYNSFSIVSKAQRAKQLARNYGITGVPTLFVDGKYETSASMTGGHPQTLPVLDELIKKARAERGGKS